MPEKPKPKVPIDVYLEEVRAKTALLRSQANTFDELCEAVALLHGKVDDIQHSLDEREGHQTRLERFYMELHQLAANYMESSTDETRKMAAGLGAVLERQRSENLKLYDTYSLQIRKSPDYAALIAAVAGLREDIKQLLLTGAIATQAA